MTTFFTSDEHYGHANIIKYCNRPYKDTDEMNRDLIARHNAVVGQNDSVVHLGDFAMNEKLVREILAQLNGEHELIHGNHDGSYPTHKKNRDGGGISRYLGYGFKTVRDWDLRARWGGALYVLSHVPWQLDEFDKRPMNRFLLPPEEYKSHVLLHGHVHDAWRRNGDMWNVGVDVWDYRPVTLEQLEHG